MREYTLKEYEKYKAAVDHNIKGLDFVSTGACMGCEECGLTSKDCQACDGTGCDDQDGQCQDCKGTGKTEASERDQESAGEPSFSSSACDSCGSTLAGDRSPAHGITKDGSTFHLSVCVDCLYYLNYGQLDDMAMMEIDKNQEQGESPRGWQTV